MAKQKVTVDPANNRVVLIIDGVATNNSSQQTG